MFLLVCSFVAAETNISENSEFTISEVANKITPNQKAEYKITFTNNKEITQRYSIHSFVKGWDVAPSPVKDKIVQLNPGKTYSVTMLAKTLEDFPSGLYYLPITVQTDQGEEYSDQLKVYLSPQEEASYAPALSIDIDMDDKIAARSAIPIKLFIENRNPLNLSGVTIRIQSDIPEFVQEAIVDLPPLEKKTVEFPVAVAEFQQPKEYTLFFVLEKDGQTLKVVEKKIEIIPSLPPFTVTQEADPKYLKEFHAVTAENTGNVKNSQVIRVHLPWWGSFLTTSETGKVVTDNGEKYVQKQFIYIDNNYTSYNCNLFCK